MAALCSERDRALHDIEWEQVEQFPGSSQSLAFTSCSVNVNVVPLV